MSLTTLNVLFFGSRLSKTTEKTGFSGLRVGEKALQFGDQATAMAIDTALNSAGVSRLIFSEGEYRPEISMDHQKRLDEFNDALSPASSYKAVRSFIAARLRDKQRVIPFVGVTMADLTFLREGSNIDETGTLEYSACKKGGKPIDTLQACQETVPGSMSLQATALQSRLDEAGVEYDAAPQKWESEMFALSKGLTGAAVPKPPQPGEHAAECAK